MQKQCLRHSRFVGLAGGGLVLLLLVACAAFAEAHPLPTLGPVRDGGGRPGRVYSELTASTNCAEVGEEVTFTLHVRNDATFPVTLTGSLALDIVIKAAYQAQGSIQRWSTSDQYPAAINPVFVPGEDRTYVWRWRADAVYAPNPTKDNGIQAIAPIGVLGPENQLIQGGPMTVGLGIRTINLAQGSTTCAKLPRP